MATDITQFKITRSSEYMAKLFNHSAEVQAIQLKNHFKLNKKKTIEKLKSDIEKYPEVPQLKQQLFASYQIQKMPEDAKKCADWIYKEHPTYLFGLINKALEKYYEQDYTAMLDYIGRELSLKKLYPEREEFHVDEIMNYLCVCAMYTNATEADNIEKDKIMDLMYEIDSESSIIKKTEGAIIHFNLTHGLRRLKDFEKYEKKPSTTFIQSIPISDGAPIFENKIFEELYKSNCEIEYQILKDIIALPANIITASCQKIIDDSIARYYYFLKEDEKKGGYSHFIIHVLFLLGETKNPANLPLVLQILRQAESYCEFFISELLTSDVWWVIYNLTDGNEKLLTDFLKEPSRYQFCKAVVIDSLEQLAIKQPEKESYVIEEAINLLKFFLLYKEDENILDTYIVSNLIGLLVNFDAEEHYALIKTMYENELVSISSIGTYNELMRMKAEYNKIINELPVGSIYELYDEIVENKYENDVDEGDGFFTDYENIEESLLPIRTEPKIGRNDSCPCGSGKKFKKCCLEKEIF
jgi:hypothetical protein